MKSLLSAIITFLLAIAATAQADIEAGDLRLRSDIQLLADWNLIKSPTSAWPLPKQTVTDLKTSLAQNSKPLPAFVLSAAKRVAKRGSHYYAEIRGGNEVKRFSDFQTRTRTKAEVVAGSQWRNGRWSAKGKITASSDTTQANSKHNDKIRLDGSSAALQLGNWVTTIGLQDRWWGPGWHGSLILSNNARPIPSVSIQREDTTGFESKWLSWLGAWQLTTLFGQLESDRHIPNARFFGMRASFQPTQNFSFGLSRTAQWGGKGRPKDFDTFFNLLIGKDNRGDDVDVSEEPGNQLAGVDFRYNFFVQKTSIALYTQLIGEDEAGLLPSRYIGQFGGTVTWGDTGGNLYRVIIEHSDTNAGVTASEDYPNYAYRHGLYRDGYIYRGNSIGHTMDTDSRATSIQAISTLQNGDTYGAKITALQLNTDNRDSGEGNAPHLHSPVASNVLALELHSELTITENWQLGASLFTENGNNGFEDQTGINLKLNYHWR